MGRKGRRDGEVAMRLKVHAEMKSCFESRKVARTTCGELRFESQ